MQVNIDEETAAAEEEGATENHVGPDTILADRVPQFCLQVKESRCRKLRLKTHHAFYDDISLLNISLRSTRYNSVLSSCKRPKLVYLVGPPGLPG